MNIYDVLRHEHYVIKAYLQKIHELGKTKPATRQRQFLQLQTLLIAHAAAEEEIFYGPLRRHAGAGLLTRCSRVEHDLAGSLMEVLAGLDPKDADWCAYFEVLRESVERHIRQEEKELFRQAQKVLDADTEARMGEAMLLVGKGREAMAMVEILEPPGSPESPVLH